jgi:NAD(P)-dependent dehydrogenase (short-subunit alcohol dehydrogenase family)
VSRNEGRFEDKVVLITGAARGPGRAHARRFAAEGANIIAVDACAPILPDVSYEAATEEDLRETARLVEQEGRGVVAHVADVRNQAALDAAVAEGIDRFGRLDVIVANAGVASYHLTWEVPEEHWAIVLDVNLTGVWRTVKAGLPTMIEAGIADYEVVGWLAVAGPKNLPAGVVSKLSNAIELAKRDPAFRKTVEDGGYTIDQASPKELHQRMLSEYAMWERVIIKGKLQQ